MTSTRWKGLDMFEALSAESYWQELTKLPLKTKIDLLAGIAQTASAKLDILLQTDSGINIGSAIEQVLAEQAKSAEYQTNMRKQFYAQPQNVADVDDAAAEYMLSEKTYTKRIADLLKADAKPKTLATETTGTLRWRNGKLEYRTHDTDWKNYTQHPLRCPDTIKDGSPGFATMQLLLRSGYVYDQNVPSYED